VVTVFSNHIFSQHLVKRVLAFGLAFLVLFLNIGVYPALALTAASHAQIQSSHAQSAQAAFPHQLTVEHYSPQDTAFIRKYLKSSEYISTAEIKPGMEGYGLSVFQGVKVEKFQVKVIGVIKKVLSGRDAILVRCSGAALGKNNVVRGMSGSPIYIDNRLAGALSYGFDFSKEPIVGVTPVTDMLESLTFDDRPGASDRKISYQRPAYIDAPRELFGGTAAVPNAEFASSPTVRMVPLMAPVALAGYSPRAQEYLKDKFKEIGLAVSSGASGGIDAGLNRSLVKAKSAVTKGPVGKNKILIAQAEGESQRSDSATDAEVVAAAEAGTVKLVPGGAVAVMLSTGDFSSSATGTATCIFGNKVVAFGHAFMDAGQVAFPMATAYIHDVLPSLSVSFKLSSPLQVIGTVFADRPWSVGGEIGRYSNLIPLNISVTDEKRRVKKVYHCRVVDHPELTPGLVTATMMSALDSTYQSEVPYVIKLTSAIDVKGHGKLTRTDRFAANFAAHGGDALARLKVQSDPVSGFVGSIVDRLIDNDFEQASITAVNIDVVAEDGRQVSKIDRISVDKPVVAPGDTVNINVVMKPFSNPMYTETLNFLVPRELPDGDIAIGVSGGDELDNVRRRLGVVDPQSETLKQLIARIMRKERGDALCGVMALPTQSISFSGEVLKNPPAHWIKLFFSDRSTKVPSLVKGEERSRILMSDLVDGSHIIAVTVKRPDKVFAKGPSYSVSPSQSAHPADGIMITDQAKKTIDSGRKTEISTVSATGAATVSSVTTTPSTQPPSAPPKESSVQLWSQAQAFPHMRAISLWRQETEENFRNGKADGIAIESQGRLTPGYRELSRQSLDQEPRIWASVFTRGKFYFAAGNKLMSTNGDAAPVVVATLPGMMITSLTADDKGNLYAANTPGGEVYIIGADDSVKSYAKVSESIVSALCCDGTGHLFIGTSGSGKVYRVVDGAPSLVLDTNQAHVTALSFSPAENKVYVGTAEKGCVYSLDSALKVKAEFETGEHIVTGVARDKGGNLYVSTAGTGKLYRVQPNGQADAVATSEAFYTLHYDSRDNRVYAGDAEGDVTRIEIDATNDQALFVPVCHTEQEAVMALSTDENGRLYCGTSNTAQVRTFEIQPSGNPTYSSIVYDAQRPANWSRLRVGNVDNDDKNDLQKIVSVQTRGGETSQPDAAWSKWTDAVVDGDGYLIKSGPGRFIQYKLTWKLVGGKHNVRDLIVSRVDVTFQPTNAAPSVAAVSIKAGEALSGTVPVVISGADPDQDNMLLSLDISSDGGKSWQSVVNDQRSRPSDAEKAKKKEKDKEKEAAAKAETARKTKPDAKFDGKPESKSETKTETKPEVAPESKPEVKPERKTSMFSQVLRRLQNKAETEPDPAKDPDAKDPYAIENDAKEAAKDPAKDPAKDIVKDADASAATTSGSSAASDSKKTKSKDKTAKADEPEKSSEQYASTEKFTYSFETKKVKDGQYLMRIKVSDKPSNPEHEKTSIAVRSIAIDNTQPQIDSIKVAKSAQGLSIKLVAHDNVSCIADATYKFDDQDAFALAPISAASANGLSNSPLSDSLSATLGAENVTVPKGVKKITIQVFDQAGNSSKKTENLP